MKQFEKVKIAHTCVFVRLDIRDFYTIGKAFIISEKVSGLFEDAAERSLVFDITYFLLSNQYISSLGGLFKVLDGCGIGMVHAGDVADACWYAMVEKPLIEADEFSKCGVFSWCRFRDDMLLCCSSGSGFWKLKHKMDKLAGFFDLKIEEVACDSIRFLDIMVNRDHDKLVCAPFLKDASLARRLSLQSAHAPSVHRSWPSRMLKRIKELSGNKEVESSCVSEVLRRLRVDGCAVPSMQQGSLMLKRRFSRKASVILWLPVSFHPWWYRQVKKALRKFNADLAMSSMLGSAVPSMRNVQVKCAWRNFLPSTESLIQR